MPTIVNPLLRECGLYALIASLAITAVVRIIHQFGRHDDHGRSLLNRLRGLATDERGAVQSLSLVLTLPVFLMLLILTVQVSELMIGTMNVHFAAFAAARSAIVWIPAHTSDGYSENQLPIGISPGMQWKIDAASITQQPCRKYEEILTAAVNACLPIAPSRRNAKSVAANSPPVALVGAIQRQYPLFDPGSQNNSAMSNRIASKVTDSWNHTTVMLSFQDRNSQGPATYNPQGHPTVMYDPAQVGWEDPITVTVIHEMVLLPGAGKFLSQTHNVRRIDGFYRKPISATVTLNTSGLKPLLTMPIP